MLVAWPLCGESLHIRRRAARSVCARSGISKEQVMSIGTILLIIVILMLIGVLPTWPHARSWGYGPSGIVGVILIILIVLFLMGRL
jgi:membrane-bound ClpP family serine protease